MSRDWTVSFPEPTTFNGEDSRPMPSGGGKSGPSRGDLKRSLFAAVRIFGVLKVREVLDEVIDETR